MKRFWLVFCRMRNTGVWGNQGELQKMTIYSSEIVTEFDFSSALKLTLDQRFRHCLNSAKEIVHKSGYQEISDFPCVPDIGASVDEIEGLEKDLGTPLPSEYRAFLSICRYLKLEDGFEIGGFSHDGLSVTEHPWISDEHLEGERFLVFADYWKYADGDQLMFDLKDVKSPVIAYLHEHGPLFEPYAPTFSLALWRLVHEE